MVGNNQCSFRDSSVVVELEPIKPMETQPAETTATTISGSGSTETTTTETTTMTTAAENALKIRQKMRKRRHFPCKISREMKK